MVQASAKERNREYAKEHGSEARRKQAPKLGEKGQKPISLSLVSISLFDFAFAQWQYSGGRIWLLPRSTCDMGSPIEAQETPRNQKQCLSCLRLALGPTCGLF